MKLSFKKTLCLLLTVCVLCSTLSLPVFASETVSTDFNSLDQEKLQVAIDSLQEPYTEGTALVKDIYTHAFSYNFNIKDTVKEVLDQVFVNGYTDDEKTEDAASEGSSTVIVNVMNMIVPTLYSEIPANLSSYFDGEPASNPASSDLIIGDLLLMETSGVCSIYIYDGKNLVKLVNPSLVRENADTDLASAPDADRYVVLRPSKELSAIHRTTEGELNLTDAQKAVIGTAEAYLLRGYRIQYDDVTPFTKNAYRWNSGLRTPEESSFDNIGFTNCAAFTSEVYKTALGFTDVSYTTSSQVWSSYTVWRYPQSTSASIGGETEEQKAEIEADFYNNIQPGDIINIRYNSKSSGHSMLYVGNGNIIHSGGYNYSFSTGDTTEASIKQMRVEELFDATNKRYVFSKLKSVNIVRPLKNWNGTIPENTLNRITTMKGIVGEKLSSKNRFSTVNPGDEITYTFRVFNSNDTEKTLEIKDTVPQNTTYVSGDLEVSGNNLYYSITVPSKETREVSYTVKINENTPDGTWITSNDATIGGVLHKTYEIPVRETLTSAQQATVSEAIQNNSSLASSTDKGIAYANKIYKDVLDIDAVLAHDDVLDIKNLLFPAIDEYTIITGVTASDYICAYHLDSNSHYAQMLVPRMFGGRQLIVEPHKDNIIQKLEHSQFVTGDIILTESSSEASLYMYDNGKVLNLSTGSYLSSADSFFDKIFANKCFAVLRPSMSDTYEYVKSQLEIYIEELKELNKTTITDDEVLEEFETIVSGIDTYLAENTTEKLSSVQQLVYDTAKTKINNYKNPPVVVPEEHITANGKIWFALGGNSRFFVKTDEEAYLNRANYQSFLPGVDFAGYVASPTGIFTTDQAAITTPEFGGSMLAYTVNENPSNVGYTTIPDFTLEDDGNYYWTIKGTPYLIRPANNVIKLLETAPNTKAITDQATKDRYTSLTSTTIDVPDKKYESLGFLAACVTAYRKYYKVTLYYADGTTDVQVEEISATYNPNNYSATYKDGQAYLANFLNTNNERDSRYGFVPWDVDIESSKVLTKVMFEIDAADTNTNLAGHIISAWGVEKVVTVEGLITELSALNTAGITDIAGLSALKGKVKEIDDALAKTSGTLTTEQQAIYDIALALIAEKENEFSSATDSLKAKIDINFNGNSKLYMQYGSDEYLNRSTLKNFLPGLDFTSIVKQPTGTFETDFAYATGTGANFSGPIAVFPYTVDSTSVETIKTTSVPNFTTDAKGNTIWTIDNVPYTIKPTEKVIKLYQQCNTSAISKNDSLTDKQKEELTTAYNSLSEVTIDVADGQYEKLGFLAGIFHTTATYNRILDIKLIYEDGEVDTSATIWASATTDNNYTKGALYFHALEDGTTSGQKYWHTFRPYEVTADSSRTLTAIKLIKPTTRMVNDVPTNDTTNAYVYPVYVLSVYADQTIKGALSAVSAATSYTDAVTIVKTVDGILAENNLTADDLSESAKVNYNLAKAIVDGAADLFEQSIKQAEDAMKAITVNSSLEDAKAAEKLYKDALSIDGIEEDDFDTAVVTEFYKNLNIIKENTELNGKIEIVYNKDALPYAKVTLNNPSELSGKPYKVILTYFDEKDVQIGNKIIPGTSTTADKTSFEIEINDMPERTKTIKGFIWKDFATLIPLAEEAVATKSDKNVLKVLSIGNSFSNNALTYFYEIAKSAGYDEVVLGVAYIGGCTLQTHMSQYNGNKTGYEYRKNTTGAWVVSPSYDLKSIIKDERWDYITLQQGSTASGQADTFEPYLEQLIKVVNDNKTNSKEKILWHTTWTFTSAYKRDTQYETLYNKDQMKMYNAIINAFNSKVKPYITSGAIEYEIPAGTAIQNAREAYGDESLFSSDGLHLNNTGNYIAGLTWFEKITGKSIDTVTYIPAITGIEEQLDVIKTSVKNALKNPTSVTK